MTSRKIALAEKECVRCGVPCQPDKPGNPKARPFRRAEKGLCADCAVTHFFMSPEMEPARRGILANGIEVLRSSNIQQQFASIMETGESELQSEEINWEKVIKQWDMPFPRGYQP